MARGQQPPPQMRQRLDQQQHKHQPHHHLRIQHLTPQRPVRRQRQHKQRQRRQHQCTAHLGRAQPVAGETVQCIARSQQPCGHHRQCRTKGQAVGTHHTDHIGKPQGDLSGHARITRAVSHIRGHGQRRHQGRANCHQRHAPPQGCRRATQRGERKGAHAGEGPQRPPALAPLALDAHQQAATERTCQHCGGRRDFTHGFHHHIETWQKRRQACWRPRVPPWRCPSQHFHPVTRRNGSAITDTMIA